MKLVIGGAYQGKLEFAKAHYNIADKDCYTCVNDIDVSFQLINKLEEYLLSLLKKGIDPAETLKKILPDLEGKVIIITDISCGIVPVDPVLRRWREDTGRVATMLAKNAKEVTRVFCGIPNKLK